MPPTSSHTPFLWLKEINEPWVPGGHGFPVVGFGRFGKQTGAGLSKFSPPSVCTVITSGSCAPGGRGPGNRSGGTGEMPTLPPRVPSSLNSELAGTVMLTPAKAGLFATTNGGNETVVSLVRLTACSVPAVISGRYICPVPPAKLSIRPATASQALPTYG